MGPLVPDIITNELNLIVALLIGVGFGYILEQAGFSSSRKLTGLFYGTDFTVLRVFFTAGATAMAGVLLLVKLGWLDASVIFVNPAFIPSALVGGAIMGVGFVLGGYCPGTSLCGVSVGRMDALAFAAGSFLGVFGFGELYPRLKDFYLAGARGDLTVPAALGISPAVVLMGTIVVALVAFGVTGRLQRRLTGAPVPEYDELVRHRFGAVVLLGLGLVVALLPSKQERLLAKATDPARAAVVPVELITADEVAFRLLDNDPTIRVVDVRAPQVFLAQGLPGAVNITQADLFGQEARATLTKGTGLTVFVAEDEQGGIVAATIARELGVDQVAALQGGYQAIRSTVLEAAPSPDALAGPDRDTWAFRLEAGPKLAALIKARGAAKPVEKKVRRITGGCGV